MLPQELTIQSTIFDRPRKLTISDDFIGYDIEGLITDQPSLIMKDEIEAFRSGIKWIKGYQFVIGRIYCIDIQAKNKKILKLRLKSMYGIRKRQLHEKFSKIVNALYGCFFHDIAVKLIDEFIDGKVVEIAGVTLSHEGMTLNSKMTLISWEDVGTKTYETYYAVFSKSNPNQYKAFEYVSEWNVDLLYSVLEHVLKVLKSNRSPE